MENQRADLIKKSLQRLYNEVDKLPSDRGFMQADSYIKHYNTVLSDARKIFPENEFIQNQKEIEHSKYIGLNSPAAIQSLQECLINVKLSTLKLMDILDVSIAKEQAVPHQVIYVNQIQNTEQLIKISIDNLVESIQQQNIDIELKENAIKSIKEFEEEIKKSNPEPSKIKKCIDSVLKVGKEFAVPLLFKIIENWDKIFKT